MADAVVEPEPCDAEGHGMVFKKQVILEGELKKSSGGKRDKLKSTFSTKKRYFVLTNDGALRYFKSQKDYTSAKAPAGSVDVLARGADGARSTRVAIEAGEMSFTVMTPERDLTCSTLEESEAAATLSVERWAGAISAVARGDFIGARLSVSSGQGRSSTNQGWTDRVVEWMASDEAKSGGRFNFPAMSTSERKEMHRICKEQGLFSDSSGNSRRHVWASLEKPQGKDRLSHIPKVLQINTGTPHHCCAIPHMGAPVYHVSAPHSAPHSALCTL